MCRLASRNMLCDVTEKLKDESAGQVIRKEHDQSILTTTKKGWCERTHCTSRKILADVSALRSTLFTMAGYR